MTYSIVIAFYQNIKMLTFCVNSVLKFLPSADAEIIIVNDNPEIDLSCWKPDISVTIPFRIISLKENSGHSIACNQGVNESQGEYVILLDCDIVVTSNWLDELKNTFLRYPDCGSATSTILDISNEQVVYYGMYLHGSETIKPYQGSLRDKPYLLEDQESQIVTAGSMMIKKDVYLQMGGLNPRFYNSCNDLDLSMNLNKHGYKNYCSSGSIVYHRGNVSGTIRFSSHIYARSLFFKKWGEHANLSQGMQVLGQLYSAQTIPKNNYLVLNLSSSLYSEDYLDCLKRAHGLTYLDVYQFHAAGGKSHIHLMDFLSWSINQYNFPILYFTDNVHSIDGNALWFKIRANSGDVVADQNGNLCMPIAIES